MPVILALRRLKQKAHHEFKANLGYIIFQVTLDYRAKS